MLFSLKILGLEKELMNDEQLDKAIESFRPIASQIFDVYSGTLKSIVESYIGTERFQNKVLLDQSVERFKNEFSNINIKPDFEIKEIKTSTEDSILGIFLKGTSVMPVIKIVLGRKETEKGQVLVNVISWGFNEYLYGVKDHKNEKKYLYLSLRKELNQFMLEFEKNLPQIWKIPK